MEFSKKSFTIQDLIDAGLITPNEDGSVTVYRSCSSQDTTHFHDTEECSDSPTRWGCDAEKCNSPISYTFCDVHAPKNGITCKGCNKYVCYRCVSPADSESCQDC